jgi:membrane fusion protein (multidrug efflux system)
VSWIKSNQTSLVVLGSALVVFLLSLGALYASDGAEKERQRDARLEEAQSSGGISVGPSVEVEAIAITRVPSIQIVELTGALEPIRSTWVSAEIAGRIIEIPVTEHSRVGAGELLMRLDSALPSAEVIRAVALHDLANNELERQRRLGSKSVASAAELDRAQAEERRSYATLLEARTQLARTRIEAPFDGLINALDLDPGAYVQPGTRIAEILDVSNIEVSVLVSDNQITALHRDAEVNVRIGSIGNEIFKGRIARVGGAPQENSGRYPVVIELDNTAGRLLPGMLAQIRFEIGTSLSIRVPARSVIHEFELDYVFVLDDENRVERVRVATRPVPFRTDQIEIREGVEEGDRVVTTAVTQLSGGMRVSVR